MNAEFNWWLLIVGLVAGAALVWLVLADSNRRDADLLEEELPTEAAWIAEVLASRGQPADPTAVERILRLHRTYLTLPPPDGPAEPQLDAWQEPEAGLPDVVTGSDDGAADDAAGDAEHKPADPTLNATEPPRAAAGER